MSYVSPKQESTTDGSSRAGKYLTFLLQGESYGIEVLKVREIIRLSTITAVPQMPPYCRGVINLRGKIIPVIDLRLRFHFTEVTDTEHNCIVVTQIQFQSGKTGAMGLVVDGVEEVTTIGAGDVEETPDFGAQIRADFITGIAKVKGKVKSLLDIDKIIGREALANLDNLHPTLATN
jgi:purine-binding chemotaxis protein CheW